MAILPCCRLAAMIRSRLAFLDHLLENGDAGLDEWWEEAKKAADKQVPGIKAELDNIDFVGLYQQNAAIPDECTIPFIPFRFHDHPCSTGTKKPGHARLFCG